MQQLRAQREPHYRKQRKEESSERGDIAAAGSASGKASNAPLGCAVDALRMQQSGKEVHAVPRTEGRDATDEKKKKKNKFFTRDHVRIARLLIDSTARRSALSIALHCSRVAVPPLDASRQLRPTRSAKRQQRLQTEYSSQQCRSTPSCASRRSVGRMSDAYCQRCSCIGLDGEEMTTANLNPRTAAFSCNCSDALCLFVDSVCVV